MILAVAVVDINRSIVLASDSRITTLDGCPSDTQLKLMPLRIRIYAPSEPNQEPSRIYFERDYGMAFSGNSLGILQVKSCLELALRNLQYYPFFDVDFVDICDLVASLYQEISRNLIEDTTLGEIDFFLCGVDPGDLSSQRLARFGLTEDDCEQKLTARYSVLSTEEPTVYEIGTGVDAFRSRFDQCFQADSILESSLRCLASVIEDERVPSLGGNMQIGKISSNGDFDVLGERRGALRYMLGAIDINSSQISTRRGNLIICSKFLDIGRSSGDIEG
jgi:hypothetical protein